MATLEMLVKLASFGTAGVCVLFVFYCGYGVLKLPNDTPEWKVKLMNRYIFACVIVAAICTVSGGVNAYFNRNRIVSAENNYDNLVTEYRKEQASVQGQKQELTRELNMLQAKLQGRVVDVNTIRPAFDTLLHRVDGLQMRPVEEVTSRIEERPIPQRVRNPQ